MKSFCTMFPRITVAGETCCQQHDKNYSHDSTVTRKEADQILFLCLQGPHPYVAPLMYLGVRLFGWILYKR